MDLTFYLRWEVTLILWLQRNIPDIGIRIISSFSAFGEPVCAVLVLGFFYWGYDKEYGKRLALTVLSIAVLNPVIKNIVLRNRPYVDHPAIKLYRLIDEEADAMNIPAQGYSFPSGHSANALIIFGNLYRKVQKRWMKVACLIIPLLVGFSRIVVGAHYPSDVLAGWLMSLIMMFILDRIDSAEEKNMFLIVLVLLNMTGIFFCRSADYFTALGVLIGFILGSIFEEKKVRFENASGLKTCLLRLCGGLVIFGLLNYVLKLPFSLEFLESGSVASFLYRTLRYAVIAFVDVGLYPLLFRSELLK